MIRYFFIMISLIGFGCASKQKPVCNYSTGNPNARTIVIGSCFHTDEVPQDARWVDPKKENGTIEQGHFVIDTVPYKQMGHK